MSNLPWFLCSEEGRRHVVRRGRLRLERLLLPVRLGRERVRRGRAGDTRWRPHWRRARPGRPDRDDDQTGSLRGAAARAAATAVRRNGSKVVRGRLHIA